jgi:hypothetical protein
MFSGTRSRAGQLVGSCVFLFVGLGCLVGALIAAHRTQVFLRTALTVPGRIEGYKTIHRIRHSSTTYAPVFRFEVPGTHFATIVSRTSSGTPEFKVGEWVTVHYPAGHPEMAVIDSFGQLWLMDWAFGGFGALFFAIGMLTLISGWRRNRLDLASPDPNAAVGILQRN